MRVGSALVVTCASGAALAAVFVLLVQPQARAAEKVPTVRVSFLQGEQLVQVRRTGRTAADAVRQLISGLTRAEAARALRTYVPPRTRLRQLTIRHGLATVDLNARFVSGQTNEKVLASLSQLVQTLSSFSRVTQVRLLIDGKRVARTVAGVALGGPITLRYLETPNIPLPHPPALKVGPPDPATKDAQTQLITLGYLVAGDADGRLGPTTSEGILAFQKFERLDRTAVLDTATRAALATAMRPTPITHGGQGKRAEILLDRQVALLIDNDQVVRTIAVSTGKPSTPTPPGSYRVYAKIPRWWSTPFREWLPWALPFIGGIAFHEFADVPIFPASHGCVRQSFAVARWTYRFADVGMPVRVLARS